MNGLNHCTVGQGQDILHRLRTWFTASTGSVFFPHRTPMENFRPISEYPKDKQYDKKILKTKYIFGYTEQKDKLVKKINSISNLFAQ